MPTKKTINTFDGGVAHCLFIQSNTDHKTESLPKWSQVANKNNMSNSNQNSDRIVKQLNDVYIMHQADGK